MVRDIDMAGIQLPGQPLQVVTRGPCAHAPALIPAHPLASHPPHVHSQQHRDSPHPPRILQDPFGTQGIFFYVMPKPVPGLLEWECRTFGLAFPSASRSRLCEGDLPCLPPRPTTPRSLHATALQHGLDTAQRGITMAVLYIGIEGEPEVEFVRALERAAHDAARPELRISILLDAARATRPCRDSQGVARWGGTARGQLRSPPTPVRTGLALASQLPCGGPSPPQRQHLHLHSFPSTALAPSFKTPGRLSSTAEVLTASLLAPGGEPAPRVAVSLFQTPHSRASLRRCDGCRPGRGTCARASCRAPAAMPPAPISPTPPTPWPPPHTVPQGAAAARAGGHGRAAHQSLCV